MLTARHNLSRFAPFHHWPPFREVGLAPCGEGHFVVYTVIDNIWLTRQMFLVRSMGGLNLTITWYGCLDFTVRFRQKPLVMIYREEIKPDSLVFSVSRSARGVFVSLLKTVDTNMTPECY